MAKPDSFMAKLLEERREIEEKGISLQSDTDYTFLNNLVNDRSNTVGGIVQLIMVSTERSPKGDYESAGVDPLDGDILDPQFFADLEGKNTIQLNVRCIIQHEPPKQLLKKYGIDEQRDIAFHVPREEFEKRNLISEWRPNGGDIGDLIIWDGTWYQAWNVYRDTYFGQRAEAFYTSFFCNRYRGNSVPTEDICPDIAREEV